MSTLYCGLCHRRLMPVGPSDADVNPLEGVHDDRTLYECSNNRHTVRVILAVVVKKKWWEWIV